MASPPDDASQQLLLTMLTALVDAAPPPEALVQACTTPFKATGSVTLLDPVVAALSKGSVIKLLPDLLTQLPDGRLRLLFRRLGLPQHGQEAALFAPVELLVLLHKVTSEPTMPQSVFKAHTKKVWGVDDCGCGTDTYRGPPACGHVHTDESALPPPAPGPPATRLTRP